MKSFSSRPGVATTPSLGRLKCVWVPGADGRLESVWVPDWERELGLTGRRAAAA
jgi:hypothetical protein